MSDVTLTSAEKTILMALHCLCKGRAALVGTNGTPAPYPLPIVPSLLLAAIVEKEIDFSEAARRGEAATANGVCDRLRIMGLIVHVVAKPSNMRLKLWSGRIVAVRVVGARFNEEMHVQFEGERACSITNSPFYAVSLTMPGSEVCEGLWGTPTAPADKSPPDKLSPARHTEDFRGVHWYGKDYDFTPTQARIVEILWEVWEQRLPAVSDAYVLENAEVPKSRLVDIFRNNSAWREMIREGAKKGTRRLFPPKNRNTR